MSFTQMLVRSAPGRSYGSCDRGNAYSSLSQQPDG